MKTLLISLALCAASVARAATPPGPEPERGAQLEARVDEALERILGPRRAAVAVEVRGERLIKRDAVQVVGPGGRAETEETHHEGSFTVTGVRAWLVLDSALDDARSAEAARVTGEMLALDMGRGDELNVIRTAFVPSWRAAFSRPRDAGALLLLLLASGALVFAAWLLARAATRSSRVLADALARAKTTVVAAPVPAPIAPPVNPGPGRRVELLPPLAGGRSAAPDEPGGRA